MMKWKLIPEEEDIFATKRELVRINWFLLFIIACCCIVIIKLLWGYI